MVNTTIPNSDKITLLFKLSAIRPKTRSDFNVLKMKIDHKQTILIIYPTSQPPIKPLNPSVTSCPKP